MLEQGTLFFGGETWWTLPHLKKTKVYWSLTRAPWPISKTYYWKTYPNVEACGTTRGHSGSFWWSSQGLLAALGIAGYLNICDPVWYPEGDSSWPSFENDLSTIPPRCGKFDDARKCWGCLNDGVDFHVFACSTERRWLCIFLWGRSLKLLAAVSSLKGSIDFRYSERWLQRCWCNSCSFHVSSTRFERIRSCIAWAPVPLSSRRERPALSR